MRVNSDETLRRAAAYRLANSGSSWLQLSRRPDQQRRSREFFSGGAADRGDNAREDGDNR